MTSTTWSEVYARPAADPMTDLDVNMDIWRIFMNATLRAAIHLGNDHDVNLRMYKIPLGEQQDNFSGIKKS